MRWPGMLLGVATLVFLTVFVRAQTARQSVDLRRPVLDTREHSARGSSERERASEASGGGAPRALKNGASASARGSLEPLRGAYAPSNSGGGGVPVAKGRSGAPREDEYVGSQACQRCHESAYDTWRNTLHIQMTKPIAEARVLGDFSRAARGPAPAPTRLEQYGRTYTMETRDGRYFVSIAHKNREAEKFEVHYTLGARRFQGYLSKLPDGRIYVLPVFWHNDGRRWVDWKEITPVPDDPDHDLRQIWNITCVNCHATNLAKNFNPATNTYATTWTEMGIGCEACHGPGARHIAVTSAWEKNPARKPAEPTAAQLEVFTPNQATPRQIFDACGYCHGNKNNVFFGFKPGDRYEDFALPFLISQPIPDNDPQGDFWPDGRPSRFNRPQALTLTGCFQKGQATCTSCHRMHGSPNDHALKLPVEAEGGGLTRQSDRLCTQCHEVASTHSHHEVDSQGSRCVACHMSDVNWRLITRRRDHTFQPPVPELTARYGVPNACTTCHEDKSPEWAAATMDQWYDNTERRRAIVRMSDAMYRAGAGEVAALPDVARLAVDRSQGTLIRASAAEFAGQLIAKASRERLRPERGASGERGAAAPPSESERESSAKSAGGGAPAPGRMSGPASSDKSGAGGLAGAGRVGGFNAVSPVIVNALIGAAADPEPAVRIAAVRALSNIPLNVDPRVASVIAAHLTDSIRLVRVSAAEALTAFGIIQLDGARGQALARAQDEWAESLRMFNDVAADHTTLGWLEAARGRSEEAAKELRVAIALDPRDARPHVYLGVLAARAGRYDEALQHFKTAKTIAPDYQNLDRLIEESAKRTSKRD